MRRINPRSIQIMGLLLAGSIINMIYVPGGLMSYAKPTIYWSIVSIAVIYLSGGIYRAFSPKNRKIITMAFLVAVFQIFITLDAGLVTKFGKSPVSFTVVNLILNFLVISTKLLGIELARAYILKNIKKTYSLIYLILITFFFTFIDTSFTALFSIKDKLLLTEYLGETFLPFLADHLLSTYVALIGGPIASLAYRAPNQLFQWFSPILPDLTWGFKAIIGVMVPTIGFTVISASTSFVDTRRAGLKSTRSPRIESRNDSNSAKRSMVFSIIILLTVWSATGLLGFQPNIIASGSMRPALEVGDVAVTVEVDPKRINIGDTIQYMMGPEKIIHRVIEIYEEDGVRYYIVKGDANRIADDPITDRRITGKLMLVIPKIGWASIYAKKIIINVAALTGDNILVKYLALGIIPIFASFLLIRHYRNNHRRFKRGSWS